eukprot:TRINITY_DN711_c0_g1_i1.p1 TRINITY_DN711_c0_g1~~TRINITY_DN711_c0_g1_i1.p1  ORF type:complete len:419 (-),score=68.80 TRINITY_DN711_c0_g1_i1:206-1462(-)
MLLAGRLQALPVIAFGGSYGGMLASWFRMKFPNVVSGAIASSAPIMQYPGECDEDDYSKAVSDDYRQASDICFEQIARSWDIYLYNISLSTLSSTLQLCEKLKSTDEIIKYIYPFFANALGYMAMADYPYSASFLGDMPPYPVNVACSFFSAERNTSIDIVRAMKKLMDVYKNYTGQAGECYNVTDSNPSTLDALGGWDYLACTEQVLVAGQSGYPNDLFYPAPWNLSTYISDCQQRFGVTPDSYFVSRYYGDMFTLSQYSNIVFTNGDLDPWRPGGVSHSVSESIISLLINGGAHHLDLRAANTADPPSVIEVRNTIREHILRWMHPSSMPSSSSSSLSTIVIVFITIACTLVAAVLMVLFARWISVRSCRSVSEDSTEGNINANFTSRDRPAYDALSTDPSTNSNGTGSNKPVEQL